MINYEQRLIEYLKKVGKLAIAFSGGVDSSYLLYCALKAGCDVKAYMVKSQFQPLFELNDGIEYAKEIGADLQVIEVDILSFDDVTCNPDNRCYFCKTHIFTTIIKAIRADGYSIIADGTNASDDVDDRPGMKALKELKVISPLRECDVTKPEIYEASAAHGLSTANKKAYACLATRVPTDTRITATKLRRVESAEGYLHNAGFSDLRVRLTEKGCRLELPEEQFSRLLSERRAIYAELSEYFEEIVLNLKPR